MRFRTSLFQIGLAVGCVAASGCTRATALADPIPSALVGTWVGDTSRHTPRGATAFLLEIRPSGRFAWTVRTTGLYAGQKPDELTSSSREIGRLSTVNQRANFQSDSFYVVNSPDLTESARRVEPTSDVFGNTTLFDRAEYAVRGIVLELNYVSYPADSPQPTMRRFVRVK